MKVDFYRHDLRASDAAEIARVLTSSFLTSGPVSKSVEKQISNYFGVEHSILVNSWTNGALAVLLALDLQPGDEVIIPAMTFIATANVVVLAGGKPVFVDVEPDTLLVSPERVVAALTPRTRAVMPVHLYGQMVDVKSIREQIPSNVLLIEDCAHCFEGQRDGYRPGHYSDVAIFSFYATKNVTCGEGGAIILRDPQLYKRVCEARLHGMSAVAVDRFSGGKYNHWDMNRLGTKANLPDLLAALLPRQIEEISSRLPARQQLAERYRAAFSDGPLRLVKPLQACMNAEHLFTIGVGHNQRDMAISRLNQAGISVTVNYRSVPDSIYYRQKLGLSENCWPISRLWGEETISLPLFPGLTKEEQDYVIGAVKEFVYPLAAGPLNGQDTL